MPDYKTHDRINLAILAGLVIGAAYYHVDSVTIFLFSIAFLFASHFMTPDIDLDSRIYRRWNVLRVFWKPYKDLVKHRGVSHHVIFGPLSLIGYLAFLIMIPVCFSDWQFAFDSRLLIVVGGMILAIEIHILADKIASLKK